MRDHFCATTQVLAPLLHMRCVNAPLLYSMDLRWHVDGASGAITSSSSSSAGSGGGSLSGFSGGGTGSGGGGLRRRGGVSDNDGTDGGSGTGTGDRGSSKTNGWLQRRRGVSNTGGGGGSEVRGSSGGGNATLWVAAGTVFLDVLTWSGPALSLDTLRSCISKGEIVSQPSWMSCGGFPICPCSKRELASVKQ